MYQNEIVKIIQYLTLFELDVNTPISEEIINREFKRLAKIYHPDVANARYKDGKKFIELKEAKDYLLSNIDMVNRLIIKGFGGSSYSYEEERRYREEAARRAAEEERRRREEAARRAAEEERRKREEAVRRAAEEERKKREEAVRKAAEEERRKREEAARKAAAERAKIEREKKKIESDLKLLVDTIHKEAYFESDYKEIINLISSFINRLPTISNYYHEYLELFKRIKAIKTIKEIKKFNLYKILVICICTFLALIAILDFLFKFYFS